MNIQVGKKFKDNSGHFLEIVDIIESVYPVKAKRFYDNKLLSYTKNGIFDLHSNNYTHLNLSHEVSI